LTRFRRTVVPALLPFQTPFPARQLKSLFRTFLIAAVVSSAVLSGLRAEETGVSGSTGASPASASWKKRPVRLPPLFWYEADPEEERRLLMLSMLYWNVQDRSSSYKLMLPVFYRWRESDRSLLVSLPLVFSYRRPTEKWMVAGLFFRHSDPRVTHTALFPFYWQKIRAEGGRVTTLPPFLFYDYRSGDRQKVDQVSLWGWSRRRGDRRLGFLLNYAWFDDPGVRTRVFFPAYWRFRNPGGKLDVLAPFYWKRSAPTAPPQTDMGLFPLAGAGWGARRSHYLLPVYLYSRGEKSRSFLTLPFSSFVNDDQRAGHLGLYFYSRDPDLRLSGVFPLWYLRRSADGFEEKTQILNFYQRRENEDYFQTLFPLYGYWSDPDGAHLVSWLALWRRKEGSSSGWSYLYHWRNADNGDRTRVFFPLYWHFRRPPDWGVDVLFPFYARTRDGDSTLTAVPPFLWKKTRDRRTWSLLFLYWRDHQADRGSTTLFPLFHYNYNARRRLFFSPLAWTRRSALSREGIVLPAYWYRSAESKRFIFFPVYWGSATPSKSLTIVPPYYRWRREERRAYGLFPLWGRDFSPEERGGYLFPFYWYSADKKGDGLWIVPPLLVYLSRGGTGTDRPRSHLQYLLLGGVAREGENLEHEFFPLYKYIRRADFRNFWAPRGIALAAWERQGPRRKGFVFPYAWRRSPERDWDLFVPLWYRSREFETTGSTASVARGAGRGGASVFFPLYWAGRNPERDYRCVLPLYFHYGEPGRRLNVLAPLWMTYDSPAGKKFRMFFPLYWRFLRKGEEKSSTNDVRSVDRDIVVLGPWYRVTVTRPGGRSRTVGLAPVFSSTVSGPNDRYFEILGGLFGRDIQSGLRRYRIFYFFYTAPRPGGPAAVPAAP